MHLSLKRRFVFFISGVLCITPSMYAVTRIFKIFQDYHKNLQEQKAHQNYVACLQEWNKLKIAHRKKITELIITPDELIMRANNLYKLVGNFRAIMFNCYACNEDKTNAAQHVTTLNLLLKNHYQNALTSDQKKYLYAIEDECFLYLHGKQLMQKQDSYTSYAIKKTIKKSDYEPQQ